MNDKHRAIRTQISVMCRERAIDFIKAFHLFEDEELYIIEHDVNGKSIAQIAEEHNTSTDVIGKRRNSAFMKMADAMEYAKEKQNR